MSRISSGILALLVMLGAAAVASSSHAGSGALQVAVTVDDLPAHGSLPDGMTRRGIVAQMVETFRRHGISTVYGFVNGAGIDATPDGPAAMLTWQRAGLPVANHTFSHLDLSTVSSDDYIADIIRNEPSVERFGGGVRYFRYPYVQEGNTPEKRNVVRRWLTAHGYTIAQVTVSVDDWAWNEAYVRCLVRGQTDAIADLRRLFVDSAVSQLKAFDRLARRIYGRSIHHVLVVHAAAFTSVVLDDMLSAYREAGVTFASLDVAAADPIYGTDPGVIRDGRRTFLWQIAASHGVDVPLDVAASSLARILNRCR